MSIKDEVLALVSGLPDECRLEDVLFELQLRQALQHQAEIAAGTRPSHEEQWRRLLKSYGIRVDEAALERQLSYMREWRSRT